MEVSDIIVRLKEMTGQLEDRGDIFYPLYNEFCNADDSKRTICAMKLWFEMQNSKFIPEDLSSDDDSNLANLLITLGRMLKITEPIEYALVLMHHRFMLGDYLEKAFISKLFLHCLTDCEELVRAIVDNFIKSTKGNSFYTDVMDPDDLNEETPLLCCELDRAILPPLRWLKKTYPQVGGLELLSEEYLKTMSEYEELCENCKPALPKLSALCRFLNEKIHNRD